MLKRVDPGVVLPQVGAPLPPLPPEVVNNVFKVLHGCYGTLFLNKFATGDAIPMGQEHAGEDRGMVSARKVWAHGLREFDGQTVKAALALCMERHPEFPPSLGQFVALCHARKPRNPWRPPSGAPALPISPELAAQYRAEYRAQLRQAAEEIRSRRQHVDGLDMLKQAIARAVADGGGDEAVALMRLDRMLAPRVAA
jgi:hypothetical protein